MNRNQIVLAIGALLLIVGGAGLARRAGYAEGRFTACKDVFDRFNALAGQELYVCVKENGDAHLTSPIAPGVKIKLNGELAD